jgi:hypothetical protein
MSEKASSGGGLDPGQFTEPPQLDSAGMLALGRALLYLAPTAPKPDVLFPLRRLRQAWEELNNAVKASAELSLAKAKQPADVAMDNAWTALFERLRAYGMLPESEVPRVRRAHDLIRLMFPDGLAFLKLPNEQEYAESGNRLRMIERLKLADEIDLLAGAEFLAEVRRTHDLCGKGLGLPGSVTQAPTGENPHLKELRLSLGRCISQYALKVLSMSDEDTTSIRRMLQPLSEHHRTAERRPSQVRAVPEPTPSPAAGKLTPPPDRRLVTSRTEPVTFRATTQESTISSQLRSHGDSDASSLRDSSVFRMKKPGE